MIGTPASEPIPPTEETIQHKTDVLDWDHLDGAPCGLEYRLRVAPTPRDHLLTLGLIMLAAVSAVPLAALAGALVAPWLTRWQVGAIATCIGVAAASCHCFAKQSMRTSAVETDACPSAVLVFLLPLFVWYAVCLSGHVHRLVGSFLFLTVAIPLGVVTADQVATHAVFWMTASAYLDYTIAEAWRADWRHRFVAAPTQDLANDADADADLRGLILVAMRTRANYATGGLWLLAATVVPNMAIMLMNTPATQATLGLQLVVGTMFGLLTAALIRSGGSGRMWVRYGNVVWHFFHYGTRMAITPWMFHSPCGDVAARRLAPIVSVGLLSVSLSFLAAHSWRSLTLPGKALPEVSARHAEHTSPPVIDPNYGAKRIHVSLTTSVVVILGFASVIPPAALFLLGFIAIGPLVDAYHEALET